MKKNAASSKAGPSRRWQMFHFSQANPAGSHQEDVPRLLRRLAKSVAGLGPTAFVHDITFHTEVDDNGNLWPNMTVYYGLSSSRRQRK